MPRRSNATADAEQTESSEQPKTEWKTKSHGDGDVRLPKTLRAHLKIGGHQSYKIEIVESSDTSFVLKFTLSE
ncbi:MAG: hypothetical protein ACW968_01255 [Candidatus Thorarchaeota archaeon]|jgi:hypothetical protein